ncbi:MAG: glycerol-3-phosphate 1-O-acyltransferase PlsY [Metamycoplasmataceae bacterium]
MNITNAILANLIWAVIGYLIGSINFSILLTQNSDKRVGITKLGSGNPGATNALRNYGVKFGLLIFFLDVSKSYWFTFFGILLMRYVSFFNLLYVQAISLFIIIGHVFPIYHKFKGGKGAASNLGVICSISLILSVIGAILFFTIFFLTRYVSLASFITPFILAPLTFIPELNGWYDSYLKGTHVDGNSSLYWLSFVTLIIAAIIVLLTHIPNIKKIIKGTETRTSLKGKTSNPNTV